MCVCACEFVHARVCRLRTYVFPLRTGAYGTVVGGHAFCCWKAAKVLRFDTLNRARLLLNAAAFIKGGSEAVPTVEEAGEAEGVYRARVPPGTPNLGASLPDAARDWEHLEALVSMESTSRRRAAVVGASVASAAVVVAGTTQTTTETMMGELHDEGVQHGEDKEEEDDDDESQRLFVLGWDASRRAPAVLLDAAASPRDVIAAALAAAHAAAAATASTSSSSSSSSSSSDVDGLDAEVAAAAYAYSDRYLDEFEIAMRASEWRTDFVQMGTAPKYRLAALV